MTQIRRLSEAADHLDELQAVMATAAGRPPQLETRDFSHARIKVIPDTMQSMDPREAITRLMAEPVVRVYLGTISAPCACIWGSGDGAPSYEELRRQRSLFGRRGLRPPIAGLRLCRVRENRSQTEAFARP